MKELVHISSIEDGAIVEFIGSAYYYMKVCDCNGYGGVVKLFTGQYIPISKLESELSLNPEQCFVAANDLDELYLGPDEE